MTNRPIVFDASPSTLQSVTPGLDMAVTLSDRFSVAVMKFTDLGSAPNVSARPHSHGEEVTIVMRGGATMQIGGADIPIDEGDIVVVAPGVMHSGFNRFPSSGECVRVNVVTPPRPEYVAAGGKPYYPVGAPSVSTGGPLGPSKIKRMTMAGPLDQQPRQLEGESVDVAVVKTIESAPTSEPICASPDDTTEAVIFFLRGGCDLQFGGAQLSVDADQGVIVPAGFHTHGGKIALRFDDGECIRVSVCERAKQRVS